MNEFELPNTRYALSGDVNIAFQVMGDGPIDIILVPGIVSHVEFLHEFPGYTEFLRRLATFRGLHFAPELRKAPSKWKHYGFDSRCSMLVPARAKARA
jgi:hypothetical protein